MTTQEIAAPLARAFFLLALALHVPGTLQAQHAERGPRIAPTFASVHEAPPALAAMPVMDARHRRADHTRTGALVGGIVGVVGGAITGVVVASELCSGSENCNAREWVGIPALIGIGSGLVLAGIGALIGSAVD
ncbi:MAG TPA: hypothetical protein VFY20_04765 [Gemmatimonadales bacterium]|nr:hypothetical protein [Gemmatimonadales bacterium]